VAFFIIQSTTNRNSRCDRKWLCLTPVCCKDWRLQ
jgi:hypothetical protein